MQTFLFGRKRPALFQTRRYHAEKLLVVCTKKNRNESGFCKLFLNP